MQSSDTSHWVIGTHFPYGTSQMGQMSSINWLTPHHFLTLMDQLRMRQLSKANKNTKKTPVCIKTLTQVLGQVKPAELVKLRWIFPYEVKHI